MTDLEQLEAGMAAAISDTTLDAGLRGDLEIVRSSVAIVNAQRARAPEQPDVVEVIHPQQPAPVVAAEAPRATVKDPAQQPVANAVNALLGFLRSEAGGNIWLHLHLLEGRATAAESELAAWRAAADVNGWSL